MTAKKFAPHACLAAVIGMLVWLLWPVLGTPYVADDIPNSQRSAGLAAARESLIDFTFRLTRQWMKNEGRFFPMSVFENSLLFHTVHSRLIYKSLQLMFVLFLALSLAALVQLLTRNWRAALLTVIFFSVALQVRVWYDPTISFGLLLPSTGIKAVLALCFVVIGIRAKRKSSTVLYFGGAAALWCLALMQYEVVIFLGSIGVLISFHETNGVKIKRIAGALSLVIPSFFFLIASRLIRNGVVASPAYATNLDMGIVLQTLKHQIIGAIPLSVPYSRVDKRLAIGGAITQLSGVQIVLCIAMTSVVSLIIWQLKYTPLKTRLFLLCSGIVLLIFPAVPTSLSVRWQMEVGPGNAYLPVMLQYLGTSLLLLFFVMEFKNVITPKSHKRSVLVSLCIASLSFAIGAMSVIAISTNRSGIEYASEFYSGFRVDREIFEAAVRRDLIPGSLSGGVFMSAAYDPALWVNVEYIHWLGGPVLSTLGKPQTLIACKNVGEEICQKELGGMYFLEHSQSGAPTAVFAVIRNWWKVPTKSEDLLDLWSIASDRDDLLCGIVKAEKQGEWWVGRCSIGDGVILEKIKSQYSL